jgi:hypothetical protein
VVKVDAPRREQERHRVAVLFREDQFISARIRVRVGGSGPQGPVDARSLPEGPAISVAVRIRPAARALDIRRVPVWVQVRAE